MIASEPEPIKPTKRGRIRIMEEVDMIEQLFATMDRERPVFVKPKKKAKSKQLRNKRKAVKCSRRANR